MSSLSKASELFIEESISDPKLREKAKLRTQQLAVPRDTKKERDTFSFENTADRALLGIEQGRQAIIRGIPGFVLSNIPVDSVQQTGRRLVDENIQEQAELSQAGELIGGGTLGAASQLLSNVGTQMAVPLGAARGAAATLGKLPYTSQIAAGLTRAFPSTVAAARGTAITSGGISGEALAATVGGAGASALQSASGTYSDALQAYLGQGLNRDEAESKANLAATLSGIVTGTVTAGFGATGLEALRKSFSSRPVREAIKEAIKQGGAEGTEESIDQIGQSIIQKLTYNPNLTFEQAVKEVGIAFAAGGAMGAGLNAAANIIPAAGEAADLAIERRLPRFNEEVVNSLGQAKADMQPRPAWVKRVRSNPKFNPFPFQYQEQTFNEDLQPDQRDTDPTPGIQSLEEIIPDLPPVAPTEDVSELNPSALDDEPALEQLQQEEPALPIAPIEPQPVQIQEDIIPENRQPEITTVPTSEIQTNFEWEGTPPEVDAENNQLSLSVIKSWTDPQDQDQLQPIHAGSLPFGIQIEGYGERQAFLNFIQDPGDGRASRIGIGSFIQGEDGNPQWVQILSLDQGSAEFEQISNSIAGDQDSITIPWDAVNPNSINSEGTPWKQNDIAKIGARPLVDIDEGIAWDDKSIKYHYLPDWLQEWGHMPPELWPTEKPVDLTNLEKPADLPEKLSEVYVDYAAQNDGSVEGWDQYLESAIAKVRGQTIDEDLDKIVKIKTRQREEYPNNSTGQFSYDILGITKEGEKILLDQVGPFEWAKYQNWKMGHSGRSQEQIDADKKAARTKARIEKTLIEWAYNQILEERIKQIKEGDIDANKTGTEGLGERNPTRSRGDKKRGDRVGVEKNPRMGGRLNTGEESKTMEDVGGSVDSERLPSDTSQRDQKQDSGTKGTSDSGRGKISSDNGSDADIVDAGTRRGTGGTRGTGDVTPETSSDSPVSPNAPKIKKVQRSNYRIQNPESIVGGGPKTRFNRNKQAIEILDALESEGREPTTEELDILAGYSGWGSFGQELFKGTYENPIFKEGWEKEGEWLLSYITKEEYEALQNSIENSHYTDPPTVQAMWSIVERLGFKGGRILEPSVGSGNFLGLMPEDIEKNSQITGLELDVITSKLAKVLYPQANIQNKRYELSKTADNFYDLVIGNWPFSPTIPFDPRYQKIGAVTHDYFFIKALDQVRPGGIVIGITSNGTMDKSSPYSRKVMARKAELVAAFRLPTGAFKEYAGTGVVTDIIIFKKRQEEIDLVDGEGWIDTVEISTKSGNKIKVNEYYESRPGNVLGTLDFGHGTTSGIPGMIVRRPDNLRELLLNLPEKIEAGMAFEPWEPGKKFEGYIQNTGVEGRQGDIVLKDGEFYVISGEQLSPLGKWKLKSRKETEKRFDQIKRIISIRSVLRKLVESQQKKSNDKDQLRQELNKQYDEFVKLYGSVTRSSGFKKIASAKDPSAVEIASIETVELINGGESIKKSDIFTKDTTRLEPDIISPTLGDSFAIERSRTLNLDFDEIAKRVGISKEEAIQRLLNEGVIYKNSVGQYEAADVFLSGNVRAKLRELLEAQSQGVEGLENSIKAIETVIPKTVRYYLIEPQLGATYLTNDHYVDFISELSGVSDQSIKDSIKISKIASGWQLSFDDSINFTEKAKIFSVPEVPRMAGSFRKLLLAALNSKTVSFKEKIKYEDGTTETVLLEEETRKGNEIIERIKESFVDWIWKDPKRRAEIEASYNEMRNSFATPEYDGSHLSFPGLVLKRGENDFNFRQHQANAVWRGIVSGRGLYAHEVGTGKTGVISALAMTSRQFGTARKPMIWAHNANAQALYEEFLSMYPFAKVLFVDNLDKKTKHIKLNRIKMDDWDAIILPHSMSKNLNLRPETVRELVQRDLDALAVSIQEALSEDNENLDGDLNNLTEEEVKKIKSPTAKQLVRERNKLLQRVRVAEINAEKANTVFFEELGVDMLIVDEAHEFKKIPLSTSQNVKGLQKTGTERGTSLLYLSEYIRKQNNGKGIHLFTGTPVTNTLNEVYNMMRFTMGDIMDKELIYEWDDWFKSFSTATSDLELNSAAEWQVVERIKSFINLPELKQIFAQYMDVVFAKDMPEFLPRPKKEGKEENPQGRPYINTVNVISEMTPTQAEQTANQKNRYKEWTQLSGKEKREAMLKGSPLMPIRIETDGSKTAIDSRMNDLDLPPEDGGKISRSIDNAIKHYREHPLSTQMFFMEVGLSDFSLRSTGTKDANGKTIKAQTPVFNIAREIKTRLMEQGVPESEIFIFKDVSAEEKKIVADKMNKGEIRFAIGSTATLGTGVNAQKHLRAIHHLDAPYMPGSFEQRIGRALRQGNTWNSIYEYRYITSKSLDARRWQIMLTKYAFIKMFMDPTFSERTLEGDGTDLGEGSSGSYEETFSEAAGDPRIMRKTKLQKDVEKLIRRQRNHLDGLAEIENRIIQLENELPYLSNQLSNAQLDLEHYNTQNSETFEAYIGVGDNKSKYDKPSKFDSDIKELLEKISFGTNEEKEIGTYKGFSILASKFVGIFRIRLSREGVHESKGWGHKAIENALSKLQSKVDRLENQIDQKRSGIEDLKSQLGQPFPKQKQLDTKKAQLEDVINSLETSPNPPPEWLVVGAPVGSLVYLEDGSKYTVEGHKSSDAGFFVIGRQGESEVDLPYQNVFDENGSKVYLSPTDLGIGSLGQPRQSLSTGSTLEAVGRTAISQLVSNPSSGLDKQQIELANLLLNQLPAEYLSDLRLSISNNDTPGQSRLQGSFSYLLNQANIFTGATDPTVAIEEIVHSLAKFLPQEIRMDLQDDWKLKLEDAIGSISENPSEVDLLVGQILQEVIDSNGISTSRFVEILEASNVLDQQAVIDRAYPLANLDEYFAHGVSSKYKGVKIQKGIIDKAVEFLKSLWDITKRFFGLKNHDLFDQIIDKFKKGEFDPNVDNGMLFESNVRIPSGALTAFSKTEIAQQVAAAKAGMNYADGPTTLKTIAAGISPSVKIFEKYTQSVSPSVIQKLGVKDSLEVEADIVAAVASVPGLDAQITEFEKNGHIELANKLRLEVWQSLSALNTKFERVAQAGNEAKFKMLSDPKLLSLEEDVAKWQAEANETQTIDNEFQATISVAIAKNLEVLKSETASLTRKEVAKDMQARLDSLKTAKDAVRQQVDEYMKILMQDTEFINQAIFDTPRNTNAWVKSLLKKVKLPRGMGVTSDAGRIAIRIIATNEGVRKAYAAARFSESQSKAMKDALSNAEKMVLRALRGKSKIISIESFIKKLSQKSASAAQAAVILDQKLKEYKSLYDELSRQAEAGMIAAKILLDPEWRQLVRFLGDPIQGIIYPSVKGDPDKALPNPDDFESNTYVPIPVNVLGQAEANLIPLKLTSSDYRNVDSEKWSKNYRDLTYARERIAAWLAQNPDSIYAPYYNRWHEMLNGFYLSDVIVNPPSFVNAGKPLTSILSVPIIMLEGMGIRSAQAAKIFAKQWERIHTMATKIPEQYQAKWSNLVTKATEDHLPGKARIGDGNHQTWFTKVYSYLADSWQGGKKPFKVGDMLPSGEKVMASDMAVVDLMTKLSKMLVDMTNAIDPKNPDRRVQLGSFSDGTRVDDTNAGRRAQRGILSVGEKMMGRTVSGRGIGAAELMGDIWQWAKYENGTWSYNQDWLSMSEDDRLNADMPDEVADFIKKLDEFEVDQDIIMSTLWDRGADTQYSAEMFTRKDGLESVYPIIVQEISEGKLGYSGTNIVRRITELSADPITEAEAAARFTRDIQKAWKPLWKNVVEQKTKVKTSNHNQIVSFLESNNFTLGRTDKIAPSIAYAYGAENNYMFHVMAHNAAASQYNQFMKSLEAVEADLSKAKAFMRLKKNQLAGKKGGVQSDALKEVIASITKRAKDPNNVTDFEIGEELDAMQRQVAALKASLNEVYSQSGQDIKTQFGPVNFTFNRAISGIITPTIGQWKTLIRNYAEFPMTMGAFLNKMNGTSVAGYLTVTKAMIAPTFFSGIRMVGGGVKGFSKRAKAAWKVMDGILSDMISLHVGKAKTKALQGFEQLVANIAMEATHAALYKTEDFKRLKDLGLAQIMDIPAVMESLRLNPKTGGAIRDVSMRNPTHNMLSGMANGVLSFVEYFTTPVLKSAFPRIADETINSVAISIGIAKAQEIQVQLFKAYQFLKESGQLSQFDLTNPYSKQNIENFKPEFLVGRKGLLGKQNLKTAYDTLRETFASAQIPSLPGEAAKYWSDLQTAEASGAKLSAVQFLSDGQRSAFGYEFATYINAPTALNRNISLKKHGSLGRSMFLLGGYPMTLLARIAQIPRRSIKDPNYTRMLGTLTTALIIGAFVAGSGFSEVVLQMLFREVVDPFQGEEKKARMFWEEDTEQGIAFNMLQQVSNRIPFIGTVALNMLLTDQPTKNELEPFSLLKDKAGDAWNYVAGAIRTGDPTYNLSNTLKSYFPITKPLLNRLPGASGISEHMNAKRLISIYAPEDLRKSLRGYVGGGTTATELSPYGLRILNAIMNEDQAEAKSLFNEAIEVAMRQDGDTYSRAKERIEQKIANMSPWRQRLKRTPTYTERQEMLNKMSPDEQRFIIQAERKLSQGASMFGVNINFFKQGTEIGGLTKKIRQRNQSRFNLSNPWGQGGAFGNVSALKPLNPFR